jgi:PAS domain-containing protein
MFPKEIEVILMRHLASYLAMPIVIVNPEGTLLYYNEPAEAILGRRFEETGELARDVWLPLIPATDNEGNPVPAENRPITHVLERREPTHQSFWLRGMDGVRRHIDITAFPLIGQADRYLGVVAIFWESKA